MKNEKKDKKFIFKKKNLYSFYIFFLINRFTDACGGVRPGNTRYRCYDTKHDP